MVSALCILNAPPPVAFPLPLTGSCRSNPTPAAKSISFFATTVPELGLPTHSTRARGLALQLEHRRYRRLMPDGVRSDTTLRYPIFMQMCYAFEQPLSLTREATLTGFEPVLPP